MQVLKPKLVIQAGAQDDSWRTPPEVLDIVRGVCGPIDLDLASSALGNKTVQATRYYSKVKRCPTVTKSLAGGVVWCNPPGPVENVRWFWGQWQQLIAWGSHGGFLIFDLDHMRTLERKHSSTLWLCVLPKRLKFLGAASQYNHPSALVLTRSPGARFAGNVVRW